jgi:hypothetical protein
MSSQKWLNTEYPVTTATNEPKEVYNAIQKVINDSITAGINSLLGNDKKLVILIHGFSVEAEAETMDVMQEKIKKLGYNDDNIYLFCIGMAW